MVIIKLANAPPVQMIDGYHEYKSKGISADVASALGYLWTVVSNAALHKTK